MAKEAELPDGTILEFPDETSDAIMDMVVKKHLARADSGLVEGAQEMPQPQPQEPEAGPINRFASGVGGKVLDAAGNAVDFVAPGSGEPLKQMGQEGINTATGTAGEIGKFVGSAVPYAALPQGAIPSALTAAGIGAVTSEGDDLERLKSGAMSGAGTAIGSAIGPAVKAVGRGIGTLIGEAGTHTGGETIKDAARAGMQGGDKLDDFLRFMREKAPVSDIVAVAKKGQAGLAAKDKEAYLAAMSKLKQDKTILPFDDIAAKLNEASKVGTYEGHVVNPAAVNVSKKLQPIIDEWSGKPYPSGKPYLDPATGQKVQPMAPPFDPKQAHTIEGLDQLKKRVGIEYKSTEPNTPERVVAKEIYNSIKKTITDKNPAYKDVMEKTQNAIKRRTELAKELSLSENMTDSTALRKLLAVPRNNANTNYGNRVALAKLLEENGADNLMTMLNGAALSSVKPRGLGGAIGGGTVGASLYAALTGNLPASASLAALAATQSPRLMGEAAVKSGQAYTKLSPSKKAAIPAIIAAMQEMRGKDE